MASETKPGMILVTGAGGHIGSELCRTLRDAELKVSATDVVPDPGSNVIACDLLQRSDVARLFERDSIQSVVHLAAILPTAFRSDPLGGARLNLVATCDLLRQAVDAHVKRFVFVSSMSVYGLSPQERPLNESDPTAPDDPYGGAKRAIELIGEALAKTGALEFVSLRVARVVGPGIRRSSSPWRSQIFEPGGLLSISIPHAPDAALSVVHVHEVARMLKILIEAPSLQHTAYNTPTEVWTAAQLKEEIERSLGIRVELGKPGAHGGPLFEDARFRTEFKFQLRGFRDYLAEFTEKNRPLSHISDPKG